MPAHARNGVDMLLNKPSMTIGLIAGVAVLLILGYWKFAHDDRNQPIRAIVADLQQRTLPPGARTVARSDFASDQRSVSASWEIELDLDWNEYCKWVQTQCSDFTTGGPNGGKMIMVKQLPGDSLSVTIERIADNPLKVRVSFRGYPS